MICARNMKTILAVEADEADALHLLRCLAPLAESVHLTTSAEEAFELVRRSIFDRAVVATELTVRNVPILARLSLLPTIVRLVATGPPGDAVMESRALSAGADLYLTRPVTTNALARALHLPFVLNGAPSKPP